MNSNSKFVASLSGTKLNIKGFGTFDNTNLVSAVCQRYKAGRNEAMAFVAPTAAELGITTLNVPVTFSLRIKSYRNSSEWANQYIVNSRPIVFEILISSTDDSATKVANKIAAAYAEWEAKFNYSDKGLPFTYTNASGVIKMTMKDNYLYFRSLIEFKIDKIVPTVNITGYKAFAGGGWSVTGTGTTSATVLVATTAGLSIGDTVTIADTVYNAAGADTGVITGMTVDTNIVLDHSITWVTGDTIFLHTVALSPTFDGKYLEENARMSMEDTNGAYTISPDERPMISGSYASISFVMNDSATGGLDNSYAKHAFLGTTRGEIGGTRQFKFTLYILEGTSAWTATTGNVDIIVEWLDAQLSAGTTLKLYLANGSNAANSNAWIA